MDLIFPRIFFLSSAGAWNKVGLPGAYASLPVSGVVSIEVEPRIHIFLVFLSVHF